MAEGAREKLERELAVERERAERQLASERAEKEDLQRRFVVELQGLQGQPGGLSAIAPGERVVATNPVSGETAPRSVTRLIVGEGRKMLVRLRVGGAVITATDRHPFWVQARSAWIDAADVRPGDRLRGPAGTLPRVTGVQILAPERARVFNLTVAGLHTYYAGREPVLVHNAHCQPPEFHPASRA